MKNFLIFIGGFVAGILTTILVVNIIASASKPMDNGILGFTKFPKKGDCLTTTSKNKSSEIEIFQVIKPNMALGNLRYYTEKKHPDGESYLDYDVENEVVILLLNNNGVTYYDDQKIEVSQKCVRQIGTFQYTTNNNQFDKTVPAVILE